MKMILRYAPRRPCFKALWDSFADAATTGGSRRPHNLGKV